MDGMCAGLLVNPEIDLRRDEVGRRSPNWFKALRLAGEMEKSSEIYNHGHNT